MPLTSRCSATFSRIAIQATVTRRSIATVRLQSFRYSTLSILPAAYSWKNRVTPTFLTSSLHTTHRMEPPRVQANGEAQNKRKSPIVIVGRPAKLPKTDIIGRTEESTSSDDENYDLGMEMSDDGRLPTIAPVLADSVEWQATIEKVVRNVVSIHFCQTCSFDTDSAVSSEATGFVVDAERGYILTNRHVVGAGPFWGYCIFDNHEEVSARDIIEPINSVLAYHWLTVRCLSCLSGPRS